MYDDVDSEVAYALLDEGTFPLMEAATIQFEREREASAEELGALDALILRGTPSPQAEKAAAAMRSAGKPVISVGIPLTETDRAGIFKIGHDVLAMAAEKLEPSIDKFERLRSDATEITRIDSARGRWLVVSEPWSIYDGWTAHTDSGDRKSVV